MENDILEPDPIYYDGKEWKWVSCGVVTPDTGQPKTCRVCKDPWTKEGHDPCLGTLPGNVKNACCGHGKDAYAYIQFGHADYRQDSNRYCLDGEAALQWVEKLKGGK